MLLDEVTGLYYVICGIPVEIVSLVKASAVFEFQVKQRKRINVCQVGNKMRMEQSSSKFLQALVVVFIGLAFTLRDVQWVGQPF